MRCLDQIQRKGRGLSKGNVVARVRFCQIKTGIRAILTRFTVKTVVGKRNEEREIG